MNRIFEVYNFQLKNRKIKFEQVSKSHVSIKIRYDFILSYQSSVNRRRDFSRRLSAVGGFASWRLCPFEVVLVGGTFTYQIFWISQDLWLEINFNHNEIQFFLIILGITCLKNLCSCCKKFLHEAHKIP